MDETYAISSIRLVNQNFVISEASSHSLSNTASQTMSRLRAAPSGSECNPFIIKLIYYRLLYILIIYYRLLLIIIITRIRDAAVARQQAQEQFPGQGG